MTDQFFSTRQAFEPKWTQEQLNNLYARAVKASNSPDQADIDTGEPAEILRIKYEYELARAHHAF